MVKNLPAMQETWIWSLVWEDSLEKGTATHSSILAWRIPWTEKPSGLQSMGLQRAGHDWATFTFMQEHRTTWSMLWDIQRWKIDHPYSFKALSWCVLGEMCLKEVLYSDRRKGFLRRTRWLEKRLDLAPDLEGKRWHRPPEDRNKNLPPPSRCLTRKRSLTHRGDSGRMFQCAWVCGLGCTVLYAMRTLLSMFVPPNGLGALSVPHNFTLLWGRFLKT